jgi:hypothetical protein
MTFDWDAVFVNQNVNFGSFNEAVVTEGNTYDFTVVTLQPKKSFKLSGIESFTVGLLSLLLLSELFR